MGKAHTQSDEWRKPRDSKRSHRSKRRTIELRNARRAKRDAQKG